MSNSKPWEFVSPVNITFGENSIDKIKDIVVGKKVLLVTDKNLSLSETVEKLWYKINDNSCIIYDGVTPNPTTEDVNTGVKVATENSADNIIGIGGGSSMDVAKAIALCYSSESNIKEYLHNGRLPEKRKVQLILIPTTSGTGSEVTPVAVITDKEANIKKPIASNNLYADYSIIDPVLTYSMPPAVTASTGIDALSHGLEAFWAKNSFEITDALAIKCVSLAMRWLEPSVHNPDKQSRRQMSLSSLLGGLAFAIPKTAAVHACSFPLTNLFGIPHGIACGLTLSSFLRFNQSAIKPKLTELCRVLEYPDVEHFADKIESLMDKIGIKRKLGDYGIQKNDINKLVESSFHPNILNNPAKVEIKDLEKIYLNIL